MSLHQAIMDFDGWARINGNLRPSEYANRWLNCPVVVNNNARVNVNIGNYRINKDKPHTEEVNEFAANQQIVDQLRRRIRAYIDRDPYDIDCQLLSHRLQVQRVLNGKGFPHEVSLLLSALVFAGEIADGNQNTVQRYVNELAGGQPRIGVDCSGFVNGFFVCTGAYTSREHTISSYQWPANRCLTTLPEDIRNHVLVWHDSSHIALIEDYDYRVPLSTDPFPNRGTTLRVVEACDSGGGVRNWIYEVDRRPDRTNNSADHIWQMLRRDQNNQCERVFIAPRLNC